MPLDTLQCTAVVAAHVPPSNAEPPMRPDIVGSTLPNSNPDSVMLALPVLGGRTPTTLLTSTPLNVNSKAVEPRALSTVTAVCTQSPDPGAIFALAAVFDAQRVAMAAEASCRA